MQSDFNSKLKPQRGFLTFSIYFALVMSILLVFWQVRNFDFVCYDDSVYVYENHHVTNGLTYEGVIAAFTTAPAGGNWLPLTWLSFMLDCQLFGPNPGRMHMVNVLLHIANTLLLFAVLKKMTGSLWPSVFVAAAFALHPMHVESVAWVTERKDVLSTLFWLLTMAAYAGYVKRPSVFRYTAALLLFAIGLMAKPMLVTLPFVLLLLDYWPLNRFEGAWPPKNSGRQIHRSATMMMNKRPNFYRLVIEKVPFVILSVVSSTITFLVQRGGGTMTDITVFSMESRFAKAFLSYVRYIGKMFWPRDLAVLYPFGEADDVPFWQFLLCALLLMGVTGLVIFWGRSRKYLPVGWFWFVGTLIPVIGLVQVGPQAYADRYTYISHIGLFIIIAWGLPELLSRWPYRRTVLGVSMVGVLTASGLCAYRQTSYWKDGITLFSHALKITQNNYTMHNNLGAAYNRLGRYEEAIEAYQQAIRIKVNYAEAYNNLGIAYGALGRYQEAIESYQRAVRIKPNGAKTYNNLGVSYSGLGRYEEAVGVYLQAIRLKPDYANAYYNLGLAYGNLGRYKDAIEAYRQTIRIKPDDAYAHLGLGLTWLKIGDKAAATKEYEILRTLDIEKADNLFNKINK
jgi:Flp pilus assembly protein TadD